MNAVRMDTVDELNRTRALIVGAVETLRIIQMDDDTPGHLRSALLLIETSLEGCAEVMERVGQKMHSNVKPLVCSAP